MSPAPVTTCPRKMTWLAPLTVSLPPPVSTKPLKSTIPELPALMVRSPWRVTFCQNVTDPLVALTVSPVSRGSVPSPVPTSAFTTTLALVEVMTSESAAPPSLPDKVCAEFVPMVTPSPEVMDRAPCTSIESAMTVAVVASTESFSSVVCPDPKMVTDLATSLASSTISPPAAGLLSTRSSAKVTTSPAWLGSPTWIRLLLCSLPITIWPKPGCSLPSSVLSRYRPLVVPPMVPSWIVVFVFSGWIVNVAPALRTVCDRSMSLATKVTSSPAASTGAETMLRPDRLLTPVAPPLEPLALAVLASSTTVVSPVAMTETFMRSALSTLSSSASTTSARGL